MESAVTPPRNLQNLGITLRLGWVVARVATLPTLGGGITCAARRPGREACAERAPTRIVNPISERHYIVVPDVPNMAMTRGGRRSERKYANVVKISFKPNPLLLQIAHKAYLDL